MKILGGEKFIFENLRIYIAKTPFQRGIIFSINIDEKI
jgi:hypothetical protein